MKNQLLLALKNNKLLKNVEISDINLDSVKGNLLSKNEGEILFREGDSANKIYLVVNGEINIVKKKLLGKTKSLIFTDNDFLGNDEFFEESSRTSTAVALKDSYIIELTEEEIQNLISQDSTVYENLRESAVEQIENATEVIPESTPDIVVEEDESGTEEVEFKDESQIEDDIKDELEEDIKTFEAMNEDFVEEENLKEKPDLNLENDVTVPSEDEKDTAENNDLGLDDATLAALGAAGTVGALSSSDNDSDTSSMSKEDEEFFKKFEQQENIENPVEESKPEDETPEPEETSIPDESEHKDEIEEVAEKSEEHDVVIIPSKSNSERQERKINPEDGHMTTDQLDMIIKAAQLVNSNIKLDDVLQNIVDVAINLTNADRGTLYLIDKEKSELWSKVAMGEEIREIRLNLGEGMAGWVAESGEVVNIEDVKTDERFKSDVDKESGYETKNMLCFPIKNKDDEVVGALQLLNSKNGKFSSMDEEFLNAISINAALALENAALVEKLLHGERISSLGKMANFLIQDIKKPILVSKRYAEHLKGKELAPEVQQVLDMMLDQLNQVADMVQTTSSYSEGKKILHTLNVNVKDTFQDYASRMAPYVQSVKCELINSVDADVNLRLDVKEFYQCYQHIVRNACDAMPDGGGITVSSVAEGNFVVFYFKDDGLGIPESIREKIFEPFTSHGKKEGTGLGLSITKQIVEAHGGEISVESILGEGATIIVKLPTSQGF